MRRACSDAESLGGRGEFVLTGKLLNIHLVTAPEVQDTAVFYHEEHEGHEERKSSFSYSFSILFVSFVVQSFILFIFFLCALCGLREIQFFYLFSVVKYNIVR